MKDRAHEIKNAHVLSFFCFPETMVLTIVTLIAIESYWKSRLSFHRKLDIFKIVCHTIGEKLVDIDRKFQS